MKKLVVILFGILIVGPGICASGASRASIAPRATVGVAHTGNKSSIKWTNGDANNVQTEFRGNRDAERTACMSNNIGVGNTFVWASKYSNVNDYASMVEDASNPENNVCFVRVEMRSNDDRMDLSDIAGRYFEMGTSITCGDWVNSDDLEKRILDAKKKARVWATVGGAVGGAGLGVGVMELFGNKALASAGLESVQGQKALSQDELFIAQLKQLKTTDKTRYDGIVVSLQALKSACAGSSVSECNRVNYDIILTGIGE